MLPVIHDMGLRTGIVVCQTITEKLNIAPIDKFNAFSINIIIIQLCQLYSVTPIYFTYINLIGLTFP